MLRHLVIGFVNVDHISVEYFKQCSYAFDLFKKFLKSQGYTLGTYACVLEVKYHKAGEPIIESGTGQQIGTYQKAQWNVHYHVLFQGDYIPQKVAQEMFKKATKGESFYTFIKACTHQEPIQDKQKAIRYVCSYLGKVEGHNGDPAVLAEFYAATLKIRFYKLSIQKKDRTKRQKLKLTCTYCNGQHWITPFQEPKYWEQLTARIVPDEHAACLKPTHPTPVVTIHEDETIAVTYDENNTANRVQYSRKSLLERLGEPQSLATLCVHYSMSEEALRAELGALAVRGDIVELPRRLWARVR